MIREEIAMAAPSAEQLRAERCEACKGGVDRLSADQAREQLDALSAWRLADDARRICREWEVKDFQAGMAFLEKVAQLAEAEGHHPDVHLEGYRRVRIELSTHFVGGLTKNDFILAAKIDRLPIELKTGGHR
jgi:4a-hydroxytetrahydrobiopterin dehydratase